MEQELTAQHDAGDSRALVALTPTTASRRRTTPRPVAFLAHLIAMKDSHPQTRERRRVEPAEAVSAYRKAMKAFP